MWSKLFSFFTNIPWYYKILAVSLAALAIFTYGFAKGNSRADARIHEYEVAQQELRTKIQSGQTVVNERIVTKYVPKIQKIFIERDINNDVIDNNVPKQGYSLSAGWIYAYNTSVIGGTPNRNLASDNTPSGKDEIDVLLNANENYASCRAAIEKVNGWQDWYNQSVDNIHNAKGSSK